MRKRELAAAISGVVAVAAMLALGLAGLAVLLLCGLALWLQHHRAVVAQSCAIGGTLLALLLAGSAIAQAASSAPVALDPGALALAGAIRPAHRDRRNRQAATPPGVAATVDVLREYIGGDTTCLSLAEAEAYYEFEAQYRATFGDKALCLVVAHIAVAAGRGGAKHFVRALLDIHRPPESVATAIAMAAVNASRQRDRDHAAEAVITTEANIVLGRRERVACIVRLWGPR